MRRRSIAAARQVSADQSMGSQQGGGESLDHHRNWGPDRSGSERGGSMRQKGGIGMLLRQADQFDLSEEQIDELSAMRVECELNKVDKRAALRKAKIRLRAAIRGDAPEPDVLSMIDEVSRCEAELRKMRYYNMKKACACLGEEQLGKVKKHRRQQEQKRVQQFRQQRQSG